MATWLRLTLAVGSIIAVLAAGQAATTNAQGSPEAGTPAPPTPCVPQPAVAASPIAADGSFPMPACGTVVIDAIVNNGPVSPEFQEGYEITIDTGGVAIVTIKQQGTPTPSTQIVNLGSEGLQELLGQLQEIGFFELGSQGTPTGSEPIMVGGPTNTLSVGLGNETWQVGAANLSDDDRAILNEAQQAVLDAVQSVSGATPTA